MTARKVPGDADLVIVGLGALTVSRHRAQMREHVLEPREIWRTTV